MATGVDEPSVEEAQQVLQARVLAPYYFDFLQKMAGLPAPADENEAVQLLEFGRRAWALKQAKQAQQVGPIAQARNTIVKEAMADVDMALSETGMAQPTADVQLMHGIKQAAAQLASNEQLDPYLYTTLVALNESLQGK